VPSRYLHDPKADPVYLLEQEDTESQNHQKLQLALARLDERSQDILQQRWLVDGSAATLHTLAAQYDISAERVRQLEKNAMNKLRQYMEELSA
jgi:RNA polymerase sigma-32 factor